MALAFRQIWGHSKAHISREGRKNYKKYWHPLGKESRDTFPCRNCFNSAGIINPFQIEMRPRHFSWALRKINFSFKLQTLTEACFEKRVSLRTQFFMFSRP